MTALFWIALLGLLGAMLTLGMTRRNLRLFAPPRDAGTTRDDETAPRVSVCIPARDEEANLEACVRSVLASDHPNLEVLVYDDESTDQTPDILAKLIAEDPRVRSVPTRPLPAGWNGKQHACDRMGRTASGDWMLFTDADVRFETAAVRLALSFAHSSGADLVSTFPRQITGTLGERLLTPMIFFVLLSYLPLGRMRRTTDPSTSAGCGQFILARRDAYLESGGHAAFKDSMHDGIKMPRSFRRHGYRTNLFDGTALVSVRMYHGWRQTWTGFAKNAYEGLGSIGMLGFMTVFHAVAHIGPWMLAPIGFATAQPAVGTLATAAVLCNALQRSMLSARFRHPKTLMLWHPISVALMTAVQWRSLMLHHAQKRSWKGRTMGKNSESAVEPANTTPVERVILVDEQDREIGQAEKLSVHRDEGQWHRAFSVMIVDHQGRVMLQERAQSKYHFGGLWTNTCCGHPRPGERVEAAGRRRLNEEMGIDVELHEVGVFRYEADDEQTGLREREIDHVLVGRHDGEPTPNPNEAQGWRWIGPESLDHELADQPGTFTPWFPLVWNVLQAETERSIS